MLYCSSECGSISIMQLLILQTLLCSENMRRTDLTASLSFKLQSTFDQFEVEHTNARCHLKSYFGVYSRHVCNISWAFNFNRHLINVKLETLKLETLSKPLTLRHLCHLLNNILGLFYHRHIVFFTISLVKNTKCYLPKKVPLNDLEISC